VLFNHALGGLGPLLAAFGTTLIYYRKDGLKDLLSKCFQLQPLKYLFIALLSPFILALLSLVTLYFLDGTPINLSGLFQAKEFPVFNLPTFFIYNFLFFGLGEEVGWRGFALPLFQKKFNALTSSMLLTASWALWHLPLFFYRPGYLTMDTAGIFGWVFSLFTGSILLTWLFNSSKGSILICAVFHSTMDIAFTADIADKDVTNYMGLLITVWGVLTIIIFKPENLAIHQREVLPAGTDAFTIKKSVNETA
jgi:membrane protease YdiL (CAAX protease family)